MTTEDEALRKVRDPRNQLILDLFALTEHQAQVIGSLKAFIDMDALKRAQVDAILFVADAALDDEDLSVSDRIAVRDWLIQLANDIALWPAVLQRPKEGGSHAAPKG